MNSVLIESGDLDTKTNIHEEKICEDTGKMLCEEEGRDRVMHLQAREHQIWPADHHKLTYAWKTFYMEDIHSPLQEPTLC